MRSASVESRTDSFRDLYWQQVCTVAFTRCMIWRSFAMWCHAIGTDVGLWHGPRGHMPRARLLPTCDIHMQHAMLVAAIR